MLTPAQRAGLRVLLVSPRNPLNIGAAARAMANFGFEDLHVVAPYSPHWREARSAIGAPALLQSAQESATLPEAVADCTLVAGTGTLTFRRPEQQAISLPALTPPVARELERGGRVALLFGPEKHGLTREDLAHCHLLVEIPTDPRQPSMNLGQAVAVCLYELVARSAEPAPGTTSVLGSGQAATSGSLDRLADLVSQVMTEADYSPAAMHRANLHDLQVLLRRLGPGERDTRRMLGLFRRILFRLQRPARPER